MTVKAYQSTQRVTEDPRAMEYRLFGQVTGALIDVRKSGVKGGQLAEALDWNRRVWRTLASDCMDDRNRLPEGVRAQIISLSLWITKYSKGVIARRRAGRSPDRSQPHDHAGPAGRGLNAYSSQAFLKRRSSRAGVFVFALCDPHGSAARQGLPRFTAF